MTRLLIKSIGIAAAIWTIGISIYIILAPTQSQVSTYASFPEEPTVTHTEHISTTLLQREGWLGVIAFILFSLSPPIIIGITGAKAAWRNREKLLWLMAGTMSLFSFLAGFSIGLAYVPAALGLLVAALLNTVQTRLLKS